MRIKARDVICYVPEGCGRNRKKKKMREIVNCSYARSTSGEKYLYNSFPPNRGRVKQAIIIVNDRIVCTYLHDSRFYILSGTYIYIDNIFIRDRLVYRSKLFSIREIIYHEWFSINANVTGLPFRVFFSNLELLLDFLNRFGIMDPLTILR